MQNIISYFIERKAKDNESNKYYKNVSNKAFALFRHGHVQKLKLGNKNGGKVHFQCDCLPEMKKNLYHVEILLHIEEHEGDVAFANLPLPSRQRSLQLFVMPSKNSAD